MKYEQSSGGVQGRSFSYSQYRYGFNNQEKDGELGEYYAFEYRVHDARLGRFLSVDLLQFQYQFQSAYVFAFNNPISQVDYKGLGEDPKKNPKVGDTRTTPEGCVEVWKKPNEGSGYWSDLPAKDGPIFGNNINSQISPLTITNIAYGMSGGDSRFIQSYSLIHSWEEYSYFNKRVRLYDDIISPDMKVWLNTTPSGIAHQEWTNQNYLCDLSELRFAHNDGSEITDESKKESLWVNYFLGSWRNGVGPENSYFGPNSQVANIMVYKYQTLKSLMEFDVWENSEVSSTGVFSTKINWGGSEESALFINDGDQISMEHFIGSTDVVMKRIDKSTVHMIMYNVTSITSGTYDKHILSLVKPWPVSDPRPSNSDNNSNTPYSNQSQIIDIIWTKKD